MKNKLYTDYSKTRFTFNKNRSVVWEEIARYLQRYIRKNSSILELGSGYCDFINNINANKKYAADKFIDPKKYAKENVISLFGDLSMIKSRIEDTSLDYVFASNFFEHLNINEMENYFKVIKEKLKINGKIIIIQPNYRLCSKNYFDDYTHEKAWSDISLTDYLKKQRLDICMVRPKFLPFSMRGKVPKNRLLVRLYLNSPIKPFGKQMLIIAKYGKK